MKTLLSITAKNAHYLNLSPKTFQKKKKDSRQKYI